jgi:hypothetical protein
VKHIPLRRILRRKVARHAKEDAHKEPISEDIEVQEMEPTRRDLHGRNDAVSSSLTAASCSVQLNGPKERVNGTRCLPRRRHPSNRSVDRK